MGYPKYPCRNCVYFKTCGDNMRTAFCDGRLTKSGKSVNEVFCDDVTGWLAEFFESDASDVPAEAQQHLYEAYEICCKTLEVG